MKQIIFFKITLSALSENDSSPIIPSIFSIFIFFSENSQNFHCCVVYLFYARPWVHWKGKVLSINNQTHRCTISLQMSNYSQENFWSHRVVLIKKQEHLEWSSSRSSSNSCSIDANFVNFFAIKYKIGYIELDFELNKSRRVDFCRMISTLF